MKIYERKGLWRVEGRGRAYATKAEAMAAVGIVDKGPDPLEVLRAAAPAYNSFDDAMADHGKDELDRFEDDLIAEED